MAKLPRGEVFVTAKGRVSYPYLFQPQINKNGSKGKYKVELLFPKDDDAAVASLKKLKAICTKLATEAFGEKFAKSDKCYMPIKDGDEKEDKPEYNNCFYISPSSTFRPNVVGPDLTNLEPDDFYGGCFARVSVTPFAFNTDGNRGISLGLQNVQKLKDGERFGGGGRKAEQDFEAVESEETPFDDDDLGL